MDYNNFPNEWQQPLNKLNRYSKREMQLEGNKIDHGIINVLPRKNIVTYEPIRQKTRTLQPGPLIKRQVNKDIGFDYNKTEKPALMSIKPDDKIIDMTNTPGFSIGSQYTQSNIREFNYVAPKNNIINSHKDINSPKIISQTNNITRINPRKLLRKTNMFDTDREITNYTPIHQIEQPSLRIYNVQ
jgi:hypothetical protein